MLLTMRTGNELGLKKVMDMTRMIGIMVLLLHFYFYCYAAFKQWHLVSPVSDRILLNLTKTGLFDPFLKSKLIALGALLLALVGTEGRKSEKQNYRSALAYLLTGLLLFFASVLCFYLPATAIVIAIAYIGVTSVGCLLVILGGAIMTRIIRLKLSMDVFNKLNETFPQEERLLKNRYAVNLPTRYRLKNKPRRGWINIINGFRGLLLAGLPGSGKTLLVKQIIKQQIQKQFALLVYDFKYPDLTLVTYNHYLKYKQRYPVEPSFYVLQFDQPIHRSNPIMPESMQDIADAAEAAQTVLLGMNHDWITKQGDFWVESSINFLTAIIWYLRKYENGKYCTLPHAIELMQTPYDKLFAILSLEPEIEALVHPFITAYKNEAFQQLEGQLAGTTVSLGKLSSPNLYYVLSGSDFTLDIANPKHPKIVCIGSNPQKAHIYGSVISLYLTAFQRLANKPDNHHSSLVLEEFPTLFFNGIDRFLAVCRSYLVAITLVIQDASQLKLHYGREQAEVILNLVGNIISGQVTGESAKTLSERFGKILQDRESISLSDRTSVTHSKQLEYAIPLSTIASLSSGEVVGVVADNPDQPIEQKMFHARIDHNFKQIKEDEASHQQLQARPANKQVIMDNYLQIKAQIKELVENELERLVDTPGSRSI